MDSDEGETTSDGINPPSWLIGTWTGTYTETPLSGAIEPETSSMLTGFSITDDDMIMLNNGGSIKEAYSSYPDVTVTSTTSSDSFVLTITYNPYILDVEPSPEAHERVFTFNKISDDNFTFAGTEDGVQIVSANMTKVASLGEEEDGIVAPDWIQDSWSGTIDTSETSFITAPSTIDLDLTFTSDDIEETVESSIVSLQALLTSGGATATSQSSSDMFVLTIIKETGAVASTTGNLDYLLDEWDDEDPLILTFIKTADDTFNLTIYNDEYLVEDAEFTKQSTT